MNPIHNQKSANDLIKRFASILITVAIFFANVPLTISAAYSEDVTNVNATAGAVPLSVSSADSNDVTNVNATASAATVQKQSGLSHKIKKMAQRNAEAAKFKENYLVTHARKVNPKMDPGGVPHYFGPYPNYAYTKLPKGPITGIKVDKGGSGYLEPSIMIQDVYGTGKGATAKATVENGVITKIELTNNGKDYTAPVVIITDSAGSQGTGATATATIEGKDMSGGIQKFGDGQS